MSVLTPKRLLVTVVLSLLVASAALANNPSPRTEVRMVYDPATANSILFGGRSGTDYGTASAYFTNETWIWNGSRWAQRFPAHAPAARSAHSMVFDTVRDRVVLFGGRDSDTHVFGDTWVFDGSDWQELFPSTAPPAREIAGMVYDPSRNVTVLYGGNRIATDNTFEPIYDMWEFDGTNWRQVMSDGPHVIKPLLVWDGVRHEIVMMGINSDAATLMYHYDAATSTWSEVKPKSLPPCANEAALVYMEHDGLLALVGGICASLYQSAYYYDGTDWLPFGAPLDPGLVNGHALTYDVRRDEIVLFGGAESVFTPRATTYTYNAGDWHIREEIIRPAPRAAESFVSDPINKAVWMFGGLNQYADGYYDDLWKYQNGNWSFIEPTDASPSGCGPNVSAIDTDRAKLVLLCNGDTLYELDLHDITWKKVTDLKTTPGSRRLAQMAYDPVQKKTVMFGGYDSLNAYKNDTWLWDGTAWTEVKKNKADARTNAAMWFDPTVKKVLLYGGIGRPNPENTIRRYSDMWSFDGANGWTLMKDVKTPGERYDMRVFVDPRTSKVMMYGGIRIDQVDDKTKKQVFADDMWQWDGSTWTKITNAVNLPSARQSFGLGYDAYADRIVLFAGYNGLFLSDVWTSPDWLKWTPREEILARRRVTRK